MKKTLLVAAMAAGFAVSAHAETSVTLYGIIDAGIGYERIKGNGYKASKIGEVEGTQSGSRFGLKGTEDLGDGLSALFVLENGFGPTTGKALQSNRLFGRQATVGLASTTWGKLEFGRQTNIASKYMGSIDPFAVSYNVADIGTTFGAANTLRLDNLVLYQSPSFDGLSFGVGYSFNADSSINGADGQNTGFATGDNNRAVTAGVQYASGPLDLVATYDSFDPTNAATGGQSSAKLQQYILGGAYDFDVVKVSAAFSQTRDGWFLGRALTTSVGGDYQDLGTFKLRDGFRANSYLLGLTVPLGKTSVFASWQRAKPSNDLLTGDDKTFNVYSVGSTYELSKRTNLYAYAAYGDNYAFQDNVSDMAVAIGLRHRF